MGDNLVNKNMMNLDGICAIYKTGCFVVDNDWSVFFKFFLLRV